MERLYFCDGTPLDMLRRRAKGVKADEQVKLNAAQDMVARSVGCDDWADLTRHCWAEEFLEPNTVSEGFYIESNVGPDIIGLDFLLLYEALDDAERFDDLNNDCDVWLKTAVSWNDGLGVKYSNELAMMEPGNGDGAKIATITHSSFVKLKSALGLYRDDGHLGSLLTVFHDWGLLMGTTLTDTRQGEFDAWMTLAMRQIKVRVEGRYLLNTGLPDLGKQEDLSEWDWKRAFPFKLHDGRIAICNGSENRDDFMFRVFASEEWAKIEQQLRLVFPDGPEKTVHSETWLRNRLQMDEWDTQPVI